MANCLTCGLFHKQLYNRFVQQQSVVNTVRYVVAFETMPGSQLAEAYAYYCAVQEKAFLDLAHAPTLALKRIDVTAFFGTAHQCPYHTVRDPQLPLDEYVQRYHQQKQESP